jgi:adenylate cyclase
MIVDSKSEFGFPTAATALQMLDAYRACRSEPRIRPTRTGLNHSPALRRSNDLFGPTVNIAARIAALASAEKLLATPPVTTSQQHKNRCGEHRESAAAIDCRQPVAPFRRARTGRRSRLGRSSAQDARAPWHAVERSTGLWFCFESCAEAYRRLPGRR